MLLLVTLCVLVPVLVKRAKKRRKAASLAIALEQTNPITDDTYTEIPTKPVEHELKENVAYVPTDIQTTTNAAYMPQEKEASSDEYAYAVVPDRGPDNVAYITTDIPTKNNTAYLTVSTRGPEDNDYVVT